MAIKSAIKGSRKHRKTSKRGGDGSGAQPKTVPAVPAPATTPSSVNLGMLTEVTNKHGVTNLEINPPSSTSAQAGGRRKHRHSKKCGHSYKSKRRSRVHGGGLLSTALLPFSLFGIQKLFQKSRTAKNDVNRVGKYAKRTIKRIL